MYHFHACFSRMIIYISPGKGSRDWSDIALDLCPGLPVFQYSSVPVLVHLVVINFIYPQQFITSTDHLAASNNDERVSNKREWKDDMFWRGKELYRFKVVVWACSDSVCVILLAISPVISWQWLRVWAPFTLSTFFCALLALCSGISWDVVHVTTAK